jgi:hypothetical protein
MKSYLVAGSLMFAVAVASIPAAARESLASRFAASSDLREFVNRRESSPSEGSFFYAYWARWECFDDGGIARRVAKDSRAIKGSPQAEAIRLELERCKHLPSELTSGALQRKDVELGRAAGDKLFGKFAGADGDWFSVRDNSEFQRALRLISKGSDPNMLWVLAQKIATLGASRRIALNGHQTSEEEGRSLYIAFLLAACDIATDCGKSHRWMRSWCIQNAECDDSTIEAYWRRRDFDKNEMKWRRIASYRQLIVDSSRTADWSAFALAPSGAK